MKLLDFTAVRLALSLLPGIVLGWFFPLNPKWVFISLAISVAFLLLTFLFETYRYGSFFGVAVLSTSACLGALAITLAQPALRPDHYSHCQPSGAAVWEVRVKEVLKPSAYSESCVLEVLAVDGSACRGRLLGKQKRLERSSFSAGDRILFYGETGPIRPPANPYQFDYKAYMKIMGVYEQIDLGGGHHIRVSGNPGSLKGWAHRLRKAVKDALNRSVLGKEELGVLQALLLGDREDLNPEVYRQYRDAGAAHVLAVSGLHVGIMLLLLRILLKPLTVLRYGRPVAMGIAIIAIWAYALFTGLSPSVVRAVTMFSFLSYALFLNRPANIFNILFLSAFTILLVNPVFLFQVGFQLSYAAVFAIAWIYPLLLKAWYPKHGLVRRVWKLVAVSLAAQLGVLPLCLYYFHQFPGLFLVSAVLLLPCLGLMLGSGAVVVVLASLNHLPDFLGLAYTQMIGIMNTAVGLIAAQEAFVIRGITLSLSELFLLYLMLIFLVLGLRKRNFRHLCLLGSAICLFQASLLFQKYRQGQTREVYLLHQVAHSGLLYQQGRELLLMSTDPEALRPVVENIKVHRRLRPYAQEALPRAFTVAGQAWVVLDSTGILPPVSSELTGLVLTQSPRVHLGRILKGAKPRKVVADGSNYRSLVERWKETCRAYGIPFYSTADSGALRLNPM